MQIDWNLITENLREFCENYKIIQKEVNPKIMCLDLLNLNYIKNNGRLENIRKNYINSCQELFIREMGDNRCKK